MHSLKEKHAQKSQIINEKTQSILAQIDTLKGIQREEEKASKVRDYYRLIGQQQPPFVSENWD